MADTKTEYDNNNHTETIKLYKKSCARLLKKVNVSNLTERWNLTGYTHTIDDATMRGWLEEPFLKNDNFIAWVIGWANIDSSINVKTPEFLAALTHANDVMGVNEVYALWTLSGKKTDKDVFKQWMNVSDPKGSKAFCEWLIETAENNKKRKAS